MAELRLTENADNARDANFIERVKAALNLPSDSPLEFRQAIPAGRDGTRVEYSTVESVVVHDADLGIASGVTVDERASVQLHFDASGALVSHQLTLSDERHLQLVKDNIRKLAAADEIALTPQDPVDTKSKPWYIETDAQGRKRLKRAHFS
jgi:hypothetical protein